MQELHNVEWDELGIRMVPKEAVVANRKVDKLAVIPLIDSQVIKQY
jgi:hypothetical protein